MVLRLLSSLGVVLLLLWVSGRLIWEQFRRENPCEMTWMYQYPTYLRVPMAIDSAYPQYGLYLYTESRSKSEGGVMTRPLGGVPVLFVPGNAGSHRQARSPASIALRMQGSEFKSQKHFDFFTVDLNEEFSGIFGGVLQRQTKYVSLCIAHILSLYDHASQPHSVAIVAHSMGGLVSRALFSLPEFNKSLVTTVVALATPLTRPVISFDSLLSGFYWGSSLDAGSHVTFVSIAGGEGDVMVPALLTQQSGAINIAAPAVPRNWVSADHRAIVWCRRVQLAVVRALFLLQDHSHPELTRDSARRREVFSHLLLQGHSLPLDSSVTQIDSSQILWSNQTNYRGKGKFVGVELTGEDPINVITSTGISDWVFLCDQTFNCTSITRQAVILPPKTAVTKAISVLPSNHNHSILVVEKTKLLRIQQCKGKFELPLSLVGAELSLPPEHCSVVNISLPHLTQVWMLYSARIVSGCGQTWSKLVTAFPSSPAVTFEPGNNTTFTLDILVPSSAHQPPYLLIWSSPDCALELSLTFDLPAALDKMLVLYAPYFISLVAAHCVAWQQWGVGLQLLATAALYGFSITGLIPGSDWTLLWQEGVWPPGAPLVLLLVTQPLAHVLKILSLLVSKLVDKIVCGYGEALQWVWFVSALLCSLVCSGVAGACLLIGWAVKPASKVKDRVLPLLICVELVLFPSIASWLRGFSYEFCLRPDPHSTAILAASLATIVHTVRSKRAKSYSSLKALNTVLALLILAYCTVNLHRIVWGLVLYISLLSWL